MYSATLKNHSQEQSERNNSDTHSPEHFDSNTFETQSHELFESEPDIDPNSSDGDSDSGFWKPSVDNDDPWANGLGGFIQDVRQIWDESISHSLLSLGDQIAALEKALSRWPAADLKWDYVRMELDQAAEDPALYPRDKTTLLIVGTCGALVLAKKRAMMAATCIRYVRDIMLQWENSSEKNTDLVLDICVTKILEIEYGRPQEFRSDLWLNDKVLQERIHELRGTSAATSMEDAPLPTPPSTQPVARTVALVPVPASFIVTDDDDSIMSEPDFGLATPPSTQQIPQTNAAALMTLDLGISRNARVPDSVSTKRARSPSDLVAPNGKKRSLKERFSMISLTHQPPQVPSHSSSHDEIMEVPVFGLSSSAAPQEAANTAISNPTSSQAGQQGRQRKHRLFGLIRRNAMKTEEA